jgi:hypothetical protein
MSRSIDISYEDAAGKDVDIEIRTPYYLLGTQQTSLRFWSISRLKEIGIERLTILGEADPVYFWGWDDMAVLGHEIELLAKHLESVDFCPETKAAWLSHLTYCYHLLVASTPKDCTPRLGIG